MTIGQTQAIISFQYLRAPCLFRGENIRTMTKFAAAMMRALADLKVKNEQRMPDFQLRIGK